MLWRKTRQLGQFLVSNVKVSTFTGLLTTVFHLPFLVQVKLLPGHLNLYLFHEILEKS